jgi:hypothetical protein
MIERRVFFSIDKCDVFIQKCRVITWEKFLELFQCKLASLHAEFLNQEIKI